MNSISNETKLKANIQAIYITFLYLSNKIIAKNGETLSELCDKLEQDHKTNHTKWSKTETKQLRQLKNAVNRNILSATSKLRELTYMPGGMTACMFENVMGEMSFVFRGTGDGEWSDNGDGLTGSEFRNTYATYENGSATKFEISKKDYATKSQVEALNWFNRILSFSNPNQKIFVSGHSKGGNKAQFITLHSPFVTECYSFNGQGFSPEAVRSFEKKLGDDFKIRCYKMYGICSDDDYVSAFGKQIIPDENTHYFESSKGIHGIDAILGKDGQLRQEVPRSRLSEYMESISDEFLSLTPKLREIALDPLMKIFEKQIGNGASINMSHEEIIGALAIGASVIFKALRSEEK